MCFRLILALSIFFLLTSCGGGGGGGGDIGNDLSNVTDVIDSVDPEETTDDVDSGEVVKSNCGVTSSVPSLVHPVNNATDVPLDTIVSLTSSLKIDADQITDNPLTLKQGDVSIGVNTVITDHYIGLVPNEFLAPNTTYTIEADSSAIDHLNSLNIAINNPVARFTTGDCSVAGDDLEMFRIFKAGILEYGPVMHAERKAREGSLRDTFSEFGVGTLYYDAAYGYLQAQEYMRLTGDIHNLFSEYANLANSIYLENVENSSPGGAFGLSGRRVFPTGIYYSYKKSLADLASTQSALSVLRNAAMKSIGIPGTVTYGIRDHEGFIREVSYYLETLLYYERAGAVVDGADLADIIYLINIAKDSLITQLTALTSHNYTERSLFAYNFKFSQPFMSGLGADALIDYINWLDERRDKIEDTSGLQTREEAVAEIFPVIKHLGEWLFEAENHVVTIPTTGLIGIADLSIDDEVVFESNIDTFNGGSRVRTRVLYDKDFNDTFIKQVMPFAIGSSPTFSVTVNNIAVVSANVSIEEVAVTWVPNVGGSSGSWNDTGGANCGGPSNCGGSFRYNIPTTPGVGSTNPAPDLAMLMLPILGFLYSETCDIKWKKRGDLVFDGAAKKSSWQLGKQYNQQHKNTYGYIDLRRVNCP